MADRVHERRAGVGADGRDDQLLLRLQRLERLAALQRLHGQLLAVGPEELAEGRATRRLPVGQVPREVLLRDGRAVDDAGQAPGGVAVHHLRVRRAQGVRGDAVVRGHALPVVAVHRGVRAGLVGRDGDRWLRARDLAAVAVEGDEADDQERGGERRDAEVAAIGAVPGHEGGHEATATVPQPRADHHEADGDDHEAFEEAAGVGVDAHREEVVVRQAAVGVGVGGIGGERGWLAHLERSEGRGSEWPTQFYPIFPKKSTLWLFSARFGIVWVFLTPILWTI